MALNCQFDMSNNPHNRSEVHSQEQTGNLHHTSETGFLPFSLRPVLLAGFFSLLLSIISCTLSNSSRVTIGSCLPWEIYNRAYKQHYARFMKKKMSKSEFAEWGEYAIELRQKAADGELEMEEYQKLIRI